MHKINGFPPEGEKVPNLQDVLATEQIVKQQISSMGANDSEFSDIDAIVKKARSGVLDAASAILKIQGIMDSKQSYH